MSGTTTNLQLFKYNPNTDGGQTFNIDNALNNNFDKLDTVIGALANLTTEQKTNLVAAINEIITNLDEKSSVDLDNLSAIGQGILDAKIEAEALTAQNGYIKFKLNEISNITIQWGSYEKTLNISGAGYADSDTVTLPIAGAYIRSVIATSSSAGTFCSTSIHNTATIGIRVGSIGTKTNAGTTIRWITIGH